jgi:hypothetical protein
VTSKISCVPSSPLKFFPHTLSNWVSLVHVTEVANGKQSIKSLLSRDHHANKGGLGHIGSAQIYSSMQQAVPGPLAGATGLENLTDFPLAGIKKFEVFDPLDGKTGKRNRITLSVDRKSAAMLKMLGRECRAHPGAISVFTSMLFNATTQWKHFAQSLSNRRTISFQQCGDVEEAWLYPCEIGRGVLDECHKVWLIGAERTSTKDHSLQDAARMMWGTLKTHQLMDERIAFDFQGHPAYSLGHLFRHRISPNEMKALQTKVAEVTKNQDAMVALTEKLRKKHGLGGATQGPRLGPQRPEGRGSALEPLCSPGVEHSATGSFIMRTRLPSLAPLGDHPTVGIVAKTTGQWMWIAESLGFAVSWVWSSETNLLPLWAKSAFPNAFFTTFWNFVPVDLILCDVTPPGWLDTWSLTSLVVSTSAARSWSALRNGWL